ncbi:MAG: FAD-binding oxidoreductase, partial [Rhodobacteraceae bacterium]|nr:FAD-binding oxidoreductase [Paracoccaceae bacterium]
MTRHVVIVGAGIIGAAIAFRLSQGGARVTVVEGALPASGASGRSFGWINASFSLNEDHFLLRVAALTAHHALAADLGPLPTSWPGALSWEEEGAAQDATFTRLTEAGYPVRRLTRTEIAALEPGLPAP